MLVYLLLERQRCRRKVWVDAWSTQTLLTAQVPTTSVAFAHQFHAAFARESARSRLTEVELLRALMRAFASLKPHYYLEEFHGFKRQVYFDTSYSWQRPRARCELCDVLFVVYSTNGGLNARMTLLQAKLSLNSHRAGLATNAGQIERQEFKANLEQWNLLSARRQVIATRIFDPPPDLLSGALLPSVGTFGVFHQSSSGVADLFYVSADCLAPSSTPSGPDTRLGKLVTKHGSPAQRIVGSITSVKS